MAVLDVACGCGGGVAVRKRSVTMKRPGVGSKQPPRRRLPLRDITSLFVASSRPFPSASRQVPEDEPAAVPDAAVAMPEAARALAGAASSDVVIVKQGRYSLVKGFR